MADFPFVEHCFEFSYVVPFNPRPKPRLASFDDLDYMTPEREQELIR